MPKDSGMTLIEAVIGMVMLSFFALSILMFTKPVLDLWMLQTFQQGPAAEGKLALMRMVREIDQVKDRESIAGASAGSFSFTDTSNQTISFSSSSGNLTRTAGGASAVLVKGVSGLQLQYFDVNNNTTATLEDIRRVDIQMNVAVNGKTINLRSHAHPRNVY